MLIATVENIERRWNFTFRRQMIAFQEVQRRLARSRDVRMTAAIEAALARLLLEISLHSPMHLRRLHFQHCGAFSNEFATTV